MRQTPKESQYRSVPINKINTEATRITRDKDNLPREHDNFKPVCFLLTWPQTINSKSWQFHKETLSPFIGKIFISLPQ